MTTPTTSAPGSLRRRSSSAAIHQTLSNAERGAGVPKVVRDCPATGAATVSTGPTIRGNENENNVEEEDDTGLHHRYCRRWHILALFSLNLFINASMMQTFSPILKATRSFYSVSTDQVNWLFTLLLIEYLPFSIAGSFFALRMPRFPYIAVAVNLVAAIVRFASSYVGTEGGAGYAVLVVGQVLVGIAQPWLMNSVPRLSNVWFPRGERDLATGVGSVAFVLGIAFGQTLIALPFLTRRRRCQLLSSNLGLVDLDTGSGMDLMLGVQLALVGAATIWFAIGWQTRPPTPPGGAAARSCSLETERQRMSLAAFLSSIAADYHALFSNFSFSILAFAFTLGLGVFNAVTAMVNQITAPCGYSQDDAGLFSAAAVLVGCLSILVSALAMPCIAKMPERLRSALRPSYMLKAGFLVTGVGCVLFLQYSLLPSPGGYDQLMASFLVFGFFILPLLPLTFECAVEATFPVRAETTTGILMGFGNLMGFALIESLNALLPSETNTDSLGSSDGNASNSARDYSNCTSAWEPWLIVLFVFGVTAALSGQLFRGERRREKVDSEAEAMAAAGHGRASGSLRLLEPRK